MIVSICIFKLNYFVHAIICLNQNDVQILLFFVVGFYFVFIHAIICLNQNDVQILLFFVVGFYFVFNELCIYVMKKYFNDLMC